MQSAGVRTKDADHRHLSHTNALCAVFIAGTGKHPTEQIFPSFCRCFGNTEKARATLLYSLFGESASIAFDWSRNARALPSATRRAEALHPLLTFFEKKVSQETLEQNRKEHLFLKNKKMSIRISEENLAAIHRKAEQADMTFTDYVTKACLGKQIVVIDGLDDVLRQQKAIGRNLNQLTMLCNMGRVSVASLAEMKEQYAEVSAALTELLERKRWSDGNG